MGRRKTEKPKVETFTMTDMTGLVNKDGKVFKAQKWRGLRAVMVEINPQEYDARVQRLADMIMASPGVNLVDVLKDALYDLPLDRLAVIEQMVGQELETAKAEGRPPDMKTTKRDRGTCVNLAVAGRFCANLRE